MLINDEMKHLHIVSILDHYVQYESWIDVTRKSHVVLRFVFSRTSRKIDDSLLERVTKVGKIGLNYLLID